MARQWPCALSGSPAIPTHRRAAIGNERTRLGHGTRGVRSGRFVVLSAALVLSLVGVHRVPNQVVSSLHAQTIARVAPLARVAIDVDRPGALIPPDFDGLSMEYPAVGAYLGTTTAYPNTVFRCLLSNLGRGSLRIGGDSQDTSCWNPTGRRSRRGCLFNVGPSLPRVIFSTVAATHWRALVGLNLALNGPSA